MIPEEEITIAGTDENGNYSQQTILLSEMLAPNSLKVDQETREARLGVCQSCDHLKFPERCELCGCIMRAKTWLADATCPINKW